MRCPKCMRSQFINPVGNTHFICTLDSESSDTGCGTQFEFKPDEIIRFPHNVIFMDRNKNEFFRIPYLKIAALESLV